MDVTDEDLRGWREVVVRAMEHAAEKYGLKLDISVQTRRALDEDGAIVPRQMQAFIDIRGGTKTWMTVEQTGPGKQRLVSLFDLNPSGHTQLYP